MKEDDEIPNEPMGAVLSSEKVASSVETGSGPTIIHLGAGKCSELDRHLSRNPVCLVLVEADAALASDLSERTRGISSVRVVDRALAEQSGNATYRRFNLSEANSLRRPTGMFELFPGLKLMEEKPVQVEGICEFIAELAIDPDSSNELILDVPGEEGAFLTALQRSDELQKFTSLKLTAGKFPLYEGASSADQIIEFLGQAGFDLREEEVEPDPDRPSLLFQRNSMAIQNKAQRIQIEELTEKLSASNRQLEELNSVEFALKGEVADLKAQTDNLEKVRAAQADELAKERSANRETLDKAQASIDQLQQQTTQLQKDKTALQQQINQRDDHIKELHALNEELVRQLTEKADALKAGHESIRELEASLEKQCALTAQQREQNELIAKAQAEYAELANKRQKEIAHLQQKEVQLRKHSEELQQQIDLREAQKKEQRTRIGELEGTLAEKSSETEKHRESIKKLTASLKEQSALAEDMQANIEQVTKERDEQAQLAKRRQDEINRLNSVLAKNAAELQQKSKDFETLSAQAQDYSKKLTEHESAYGSQQKRIEELEEGIKTEQEQLATARARLAELEGAGKESAMRQNLLDHEISRAEAQIELIKDVLLKDIGV